MKTKICTKCDIEKSIDNSHIIHCAKGQQKTCGGFIWKYKNE